jgi:perosamine synthetase
MYKIPLSRPSYLPYIDEVLQATEKVLRSGNIAQGEVVAEFERRIADYAGTKYAIAVSSGTAGLFLCLKAVGIGQGDEVITSPYSFIASSNVIVHAGANPVFVDIDRETYNMQYRNISDYLAYHDHNIKAVLPVDCFGLPVDTSKMRFRHENGYYKWDDTKIILDACESFGSKIDRPFDAAVYAFYPNKQLTTGEGGCIVTDNKDIADYCRAMRNQGRKEGDKWLDSSYVGWNFRMTDLQAAIGIVQLNHWDEIKLKRQWAALQYTAELGELFCDRKINWQEYTTDDMCPFVFTVEVDNRDKVMQYMLSHGIEVKPYFPCIHLQKPYRGAGYHEGMFPVAEEIASRTLAMPFWSDISEGEISEVCRVLKEAL